MNHTIKFFIIPILFILISIATAENNSPTPYRPASRQNSVLFVEDPGDSYFGPATKPDPLWDSVLTEILGAGNFAWFGPTTGQYQDGPTLDTIQNYGLVIWNCYDFLWTSMALTDNDQNNIANYLADSGKVWLIGQDVLQSGVSDYWMMTNFHFTFAIEDYAMGILWLNIHGLAEIDSININITADYQNYYFYPDGLFPDDYAHAVLEDIDYSQNVGIFYPGQDFMSAFWTTDGRNPNSWNDWVTMVSGMLNAFGIIGIRENHSQTPLQKSQLHISPDPFVNSTTISYNVLIPANINLQVFDNLGRHVITLVDDYKYAGSFKIIWNGKDAKSVKVSNGVYFVKLTCGESACTAKLSVIR